MSNSIEKLLANAVIQIPLPLLHEADIKILYKDEDPDNWATDNVTYTFLKGPLECPFYSGFYYIPGYSRYVINRLGELIVVRTGLKRKWWKTVPGKESIRGGYFTLSVRDDFGIAKRLYRHRAVCLTFKMLKTHPANLVVNHLNGIGGDDSEDNLEFCTQAENVRHAYMSGLHKNRVVGIDALNWKTGETRSFNTIRSCAQELGMPYPTVYNRVDRGNQRRYSDGWRFKPRQDQWLPLNATEGLQEGKRDVIARNISTGISLVFDSIENAARGTGVRSRSIQRQCVLEPFIPLQGWNFRYIGKFEGWPQYTDKHLRIFESRPTNAKSAIEVYDFETNQELFFLTPEEAAKHFQLSPVTIYSLAKNESIRKNRFKFRLIRTN